MVDTQSNTSKQGDKGTAKQMRIKPGSMTALQIRVCDITSRLWASLANSSLKKL